MVSITMHNESRYSSQIRLNRIYITITRSCMVHMYCKSYLQSPANLSFKSACQNCAFRRRPYESAYRKRKNAFSHTLLTSTKGDVEGHRVCDKHIVRWRSHHPQWPWWTFQHAGYCPSSSWSRRTNPNIWEDDTTLTAYLPPSGCRIVQRNRCPPNHPVVGMTSGISDKRINIVATLSRY
jgi:hypothetical protein